MLIELKIIIINSINQFNKHIKCRTKKVEEQQSIDVQSFIQIEYMKHIIFKIIDQSHVFSSKKGQYNI